MKYLQKIHNSSCVRKVSTRNQQYCFFNLMWCWCGYLFGARCKLFAYGPADATAIPKPHHLLPHLNPHWFYLSGTGLPRLSWKRGH